MTQAITHPICVAIGCDNRAAAGRGGFCHRCHDELEALGQRPDWPEARQDAIGQNGPTGDHYTTAPAILLHARGHLEDRAASRDSEAGERSMARTVAIFNAASGHRLSEREGWLFMVALKIARSQGGGHNPDDYEDLAAYAALFGECAGRG